MGLKKIGEYITEFEVELEELEEMRESGVTKDWTKAKMDRKNILEDKIAEFEIERDNRLEEMGESRRPGDTEEGDPKGYESLGSPWDRTKPKKGTYPTVGPNGPGSLNLQGDWEGPIELFEFEDIEEGWTSCTMGYYWHKLLGGGICQFEENWYRNWDFDYEPPAGEVIDEESEDVQLEDPEIPQAPTPGSSKDPTPPMTGKTVQQMVQESRRLPIKMSPEEEKARENNIAHIKHLREEMKKLLEKWKKEVENEQDGLVKVVQEMNIEKLKDWLDSIRNVLDITVVSPIYIPTVREEWINVVKQKEGYNTWDLQHQEPTKEPKKSEEPKPVRRSVAKKSGTKQQRPGSKKGDSEGPHPSTGEDPGDQPKDPGDAQDPLHPGEDPQEPIEDPDPPQLEEDPELFHPPLAKKPKAREPKPKGSKPKDDTPGDPASRSTAGGLSEDRPWYKTGYDTKKTGAAAVPPEGLLDVTRKLKAGQQPKPSTSEGGSASKRKRTTPSKWLPHTQPRSTYMMGNKITPVWGLIHKGSMNPTDDWRVPIYQPPKLTEKQQAA